MKNEMSKSEKTVIVKKPKPLTAPKTKKKEKPAAKLKKQSRSEQLEEQKLFTSLPHVTYFEYPHKQISTAPI